MTASPAHGRAGSPRPRRVSRCVLFGGEVFGSYRVSDGRFPIYENINNTNQLGEFKVGALFSLLRKPRHRQPPVRCRRIRASRPSQARLDVMLVQLNVQHEALKSYWRWVAAGEEIRVFEELLEISRGAAGGAGARSQRRRAPAYRADRERTEPAAPSHPARTGQARFRNRV